MVILLFTLVMVLALLLSFAIGCAVAMYKKESRIIVSIDEWYVKPWFSRLTQRQKERLTSEVPEGYTHIYFGFFDWLFQAKEDWRYAGFHNRDAKTVSKTE